MLVRETVSRTDHDNFTVSANCGGEDVIMSKKFVFIAHWVENWNWLLWWFKPLHDNPFLSVVFLPLWPLCALMAVIYLVGCKAYDVVDNFTFAGVSGETILIRNFGWHFLRQSWRNLAFRRICAAVLDAQKRGATVIGLGALVKDESVSRGGAKIVEALGDRLRVPIVHGDTLTAAVVVEQALAIIYRMHIDDKTVFLVGATSKIGRAVALSLVAHGIRVRMFTKNQDRYEMIREEAYNNNIIIRRNALMMDRAETVQNGKDCPLWIIGKALPKGKELIQHIPRNAIVLNFSVPDPLSPRLLRRRPDIRHFDGGLMAYDPKATTLEFRMRLLPGLTYACHAGTIVHAHMGWTDHEVGPVDWTRLKAVFATAQDVGFFLPAPTSFLRPTVLP